MGTAPFSISSRAPQLSISTFLTRVDGAPLDLIKLLAAAAMIAAHANVMVLGDSYPFLWSVSRISFPLFCLAVAINLSRKTSASRYVLMLLLLATATQPIYAVSIPGIQSANVLFTLAIGAAIAVAIRERHWAIQHAVFAVGVLLIFALPTAATAGFEFGLAGMLFPAAILLVLSAWRTYVVWLVALVLGLNWSGEFSLAEPWNSDTFDFVFAVIGSLFALLAAITLSGRPRFLPRYFLHVLYPGHFAVLAMLRLLTLGVA